MTAGALAVEYRATAGLIPYARNARTHSDAQVAQIAASIKEFGFTNPVLVDGENGIIAGHGRVLAAQLLSMATVPTIALRHLSETQRRAYVLADNKLALNAGWDAQMLALEFGELEGLGFDLALTGFDETELVKLVGMGDVGTVDMPDLPSGERQPFQQMTFTLGDAQAVQVRSAMDVAAAMGAFVDTGNENSNGNALARICETFLTTHGQR